MRYSVWALVDPRTPALSSRRSVAQRCAVCAAAGQVVRAADAEHPLLRPLRRGAGPRGGGAAPQHTYDQSTRLVISKSPIPHPSPINGSLVDCSDNNALDAHIARARDPRCSLLAPTAYARASARSGLGLQCVASSVAAQRCQGRLLNALQRWRKRSWSSRRTRGGRHPAISASWRALWRALCAAR